MNVVRRWHDEKGPYIKPISRTKVHFLNPSYDEILLSDICWHLAKINRYNGGTRQHYSVAEHSVLMAQWCLDRNLVSLVPYCIVHDAAEYLFGDFIAPLKPYLGGFELIQHKFEHFMFDVCGLYPEIPEQVHELDKAICGWENMQLRDYPEPDSPCKIEWVQDIVFMCWSPERAFAQYQMFFEQYVPNFKGVR